MEFNLSTQVQYKFCICGTLIMVNSNDCNCSKYIQIPSYTFNMYKTDKSELGEIRA